MAALRRLSLVLLPLLIVSLLAGLPGLVPAARADDCAFPFTPTAYEDLKDRQLFLSTIELASFNMLFPGQPYFALPDLKFGARNARKTQPGKIPPVLLKSISWIESSVTQGGADVPFGSIGPALVSFDCGYGATQVTTGMTVPTGENGRGSPEQALVATHYAYNIARGAYIFADKWNQGGEKLPIAGSDTNGLPAVLENWYFAIWAYNGFTGPGANRSNHPLDPIYAAWPRPAYSCGPTGDGKGHNRGNYPYQELVLGCALNPPIVDGKPLWQTQPVSLPDLNDPNFRNPLKIENFVYPYTRMDIPSPQPLHVDNTQPPSQSLRDKVLGSPQMSIGKTQAKVGYSPSGGSTVDLVDVTNNGSGVLAWYAIPSVSWLQVSPYTGVAVGNDLKCSPGNPCDRVGHMQISIDASRAPPGRQQASVTVQALGSNQQMVINVDVSQVLLLGAPGVSRTGPGR